MEIEDYPDNRHISIDPMTPPNSSNSVHNAKNINLNIDPVVKKPGTVKTKTLGDKIKESFKPEDIAQVRDYIVLEVLIPKFKDAIYSMITGTIDSIFGISQQPTSSASRYSYAKPVNYVSYSKMNMYKTPRRNDREEQHDYSNLNEIVLYSRADAEAIINRMAEICNQYGQVTVANVFELADMTNNNYTNYNYGWTSTTGAQVVRLPGDRYSIQLPSPRPLD